MAFPAVVGQLGHHKLSHHYDRLKQIVQFMCDAPGKGANRFHFQRLPKLCLHFAPVSHVAGNREHNFASTDKRKTYRDFSPKKPPVLPLAMPIELLVFASGRSFLNPMARALTKPSVIDAYRSENNLAKAQASRA